MSVPVQPDVALENRFAQELPELSISWSADEAADPQLVVLNDALADQLDLDPEYLKSHGGLTC